MRTSARDVRYGRRGGRWAPDPQTEKDAAAIDRWHQEQAALAAAAEAAGEQLALELT
jgi:hypothetical protein